MKPVHIGGTPQLDTGPMFLTITEAASSVGINESQIHRLIGEKALSTTQFGRRRYVLFSSLKAWAKQFEPPPPPPPPPKPAPNGHKITPSPARPDATIAAMPQEMRALAKRLNTLAEQDLLAQEDLNHVTARLAAWAFQSTQLLQRWEAKGHADERRDQLIERARAAGLRNTVAASIDQTFDPRGFFVYLLWGENGDAPVYVGQSSNVLARVGQHLRDPKKMAHIRTVQLIRCKTRREMADAERRLIREYTPSLNKAGISR